MQVRLRPFLSRFPFCPPVGWFPYLRGWGLLLLASASLRADPVEAQRRPFVENYAALAHAAYTDALTGVRHLQQVVARFAAAPDAQGLAACREAWTRARWPYLVTEVFRFYGGPIDDENGPEGLINSWPVDEAWLEHLLADRAAFPVIGPEVLRAANQKEGEKNVATGWHAAEFLLWGVDADAQGPGSRPLADFTSDGLAARRLEALVACCALLEMNLAQVTTAWEERADGTGYRHDFVNQKPEDALALAITGLFYLSGQEMAGERLSTAMETRDQEDEQSCFSDTTPQDFAANLEGLRMIWLGRHESRFAAENDVTGPGMRLISQALDTALTEEIDAHLKKAAELLAAVPSPFDQAIQAPDGSHARRMLEHFRQCLEELSTCFQTLSVRLEVHLRGGPSFAG
jgi:putative iron-regulated protein